MKKGILILICTILVFGIMFISADITPADSMNFRNVYNLTNVNYLTGEDINITGWIISQGVNLSAVGDLNVNSSDYWDGLNTPSDINAGDITDDNTYALVAGETFTGNVTSPWFLGKFNWTEDSPLLSFDGSTLSFDFTQLNNSYDSRYVRNDTSGQNYIVELTQLNFDSGWTLRDEDFSSVSRLLLEAGGANDNAELFLAPKGTATESRLTLSNSPSLANYNAIQIGSNGNKTFLDSEAEGSGTALPFYIQQDGVSVISVMNGSHFVGINTTDPQNTLNILGDLNVTRDVILDLNWTYLQNYPVACPSGTFLTQLDDSITCTAPVADDVDPGDFPAGDYSFDGSVGIGTSSPITPLDVNGSINFPEDTWIKTGGTNILRRASANGDTYLDASPGNDVRISENGATNWNFQSDGSFSSGNFDFKITSSGNVGIGTTSPDGDLHISKTTDQARLKLTNSNHTWRLDADTLSGRDYFSIFDETNGAHRLSILESNGNVGIGTSSPGYPLQVNGTVSGVSIFSEGNISATGFIERTNVFDKSQGKAIGLLRDSDYFKTNGEINHSRFYGYTKWTTTQTDLSRPVIVENQREVFNETTNETEIITENETTYPYEVNVTQEGVNLGKEVALLRQQVYELTEALCSFTPYKNEQICVDFAEGNK